LAFLRKKVWRGDGLIWPKLWRFLGGLGEMCGFFDGNLMVKLWWIDGGMPVFGWWFLGVKKMPLYEIYFWLDQFPRCISSGVPPKPSSGTNPCSMSDFVDSALSATCSDSKLKVAAILTSSRLLIRHHNRDLRRRHNPSTGTCDGHYLRTSRRQLRRSQVVATGGPCCKR
jgi:hypothetical protein